MVDQGIRKNADRELRIVMLDKTNRRLFTGIKSLLVLLLLTATIFADERYVLQYDAPGNNETVTKKGKGKKPPKFGYMQTALPIGNGRLGAMFSGGIDTELLVINDITLWMNASRGLDEVAQSGTRVVEAETFETVRSAYREGKYGSKKGSMESLATEHLSSKLKLGNYAPFSDVEISTGHDRSAVTDYRRALDSRTGLGTVSYSIGESKFTREYFCSHPHDCVVVRYTADGATVSF